MIKPDYNNSLISITGSILNHYGYEVSNTVKLLDDYLIKYNPKHIVLMLIDGMGINIMNNHLSKDDLLYKNLKMSLSSVFPPTTVAATNALLSGKAPYESGYVGWMQYNKIDDAHTMVFLNEDFYDGSKKLSVHMMKDMLAYDDILTKINNINPAVHTEKIMPGFAVGGYHTFDEQLDRALMITKGKPSFSYLYHDQPDSVIHKYGTEDQNVTHLLKNINASYERFLSEIDDDVFVITIADHGLVDVEMFFIHEYKDFLDTLRMMPALESRCGAFYLKEGMDNEFKTLFHQYFQPGFLLLSKEEFYKTNLLGPGSKHPHLDDFIGDYMAISIGNKAIHYLKDKGHKGHHAGLTKEELEIPLIVNKS